MRDGQVKKKKAWRGNSPCGTYFEAFIYTCGTFYLLRWRLLLISWVDVHLSLWVSRSKTLLYLAQIQSPKSYSIWHKNIRSKVNYTLLYTIFIN